MCSSVKYIGFNVLYFNELLIKGGTNRVLYELDILQIVGVNCVRIFIGSDGKESTYKFNAIIQKSPCTIDEKVLIGLDFLLNELNKRKIKSIVVLSNFWFWSAGLSQYVS